MLLITTIGLKYDFTVSQLTIDVEIVVYTMHGRMYGKNYMYGYS